LRPLAGEQERCFRAQAEDYNRIEATRQKPAPAAPQESHEDSLTMGCAAPERRRLRAPMRQYAASDRLFKSGYLVVADKG
jgi:hypothetical protein